MLRTLLLTIAFCFGIACQAFLLLVGKEIKWRRLKTAIIALLLLSLLTLLPAKNERPYHLSTHLTTFLLVFTQLFLVYFVYYHKEHILPIINKQTVLVFTIAFWFIILRQTGTSFIPFLIWCMSSLWCGLLLFLSLLCSVGTLIWVFTNFNIGFKLRILFYVWFLFTVLCTNALYLFFEVVSFIDAMSQKPVFSAMVEAFFTGAIFLSTFSYALYLYLLNPMPIKNGQSFKDRRRELEEYIKLLSTKFYDSQLNRVYAFLILFGGAGLFIVNTLFPVIPDLLLLAMFIVIAPQLPLSAPVKKK